MKIIISPAKKMIQEREILVPQNKPVFQKDAEYLAEKLKQYSIDELKKLMSCNEKLAQLNYERYQHMKFEKLDTPALLAYEGLQYQYMAPSVFEKNHWAYVQEHLCILSGLYGILRPLDGISPYRLEMQAKLATKNAKDLYQFWGQRIYQELVKQIKEQDNIRKQSPSTGEQDTTTILNLASKEYSKVIEPYVTDDITLINCVFGTLQEGKIKVKATEAKMARGEMVRFMAEQQVEQVSMLKKFTRLGFSYAEEYSGSNQLVFLKEEKSGNSSNP